MGWPWLEALFPDSALSDRLSPACVFRQEEQLFPLGASRLRPSWSPPVLRQPGLPLPLLWPPPHPSSQQFQIKVLLIFCSLSWGCVEEGLGAAGFQSLFQNSTSGIPWWAFSLGESGPASDRSPAVKPPECPGPGFCVALPGPTSTSSLSPARPSWYSLLISNRGWGGGGRERGLMVATHHPIFFPFPFGRNS